MKQSDKGYKTKVKKVKEDAYKTPCKKQECYVQYVFENGQEIRECVTCGKIIEIK